LGKNCSRTGYIEKLTVGTEMVSVNVERVYVTEISVVYSKSGYSGGVNMWKVPSRAGSISSLSSLPTTVCDFS